MPSLVKNEELDDRSSPIEADIVSVDRLPTVGLRDLYFAVFLAVLTLAMLLSMLTTYPPPSYDEPGFVDPAVNLARHGYLGTQIYNGIIPGMQAHVYWQPPLYFIVLAGWFKMFGFGLLQARMLSVVSAVGIVLCAYFLARRWANPWAGLTASTLLAVSIVLLFSGRTARMDAPCMLLILLSALAYVKADDTGNLRWYAGAGILAGLAFLTHPLGVIAAIAMVLHLFLRYGARALRAPALWAAVSPVILATLAWAAYIAQDIRAFEQQMIIQTQRPVPFWFPFQMDKLHALMLISMFIAGGWVLFKGARAKHASFLGVLVLVATVLGIYGRNPYYFLYYVPLMCVCLALMLSHQKTRKLAVVLVVISLLNELTGFGVDYRRYHSNSYSQMAQAIKQTIPPGKRVFMANSDVSPYFALYGRDTLYANSPPSLFPGYHQADVARSCDYLTISAPFDFSPDIKPIVQPLHPFRVIDLGPRFHLLIYKMH